MTTFQRSGQRAADQLRPVRITRHYTMHAEGSVLIEFGNTKVLCTASVDEKVPPHKRGSGEGWVTAEYGMLPRATHTRSDREAANYQSGRTKSTATRVPTALISSGGDRHHTMGQTSICKRNAVDDLMVDAAIMRHIYRRILIRANLGCLCVLG